MAEETAEQGQPEVRGVEQQGATAADLSGSVSTEGPKAPEIVNTPPAKEQTPEEKAAAEKEAADKALAADKEAADKKEAEDKATADAEAAKQKEIEDNAYPVYNDEAADAVTAMLKEAGVSVKEAWEIFGGAQENRTLESIDLTKLTEKLGKEKATVVMTAVKDYWNRNVETTRTIANAALEVAGGKESFEKVRLWALAREKTDPAFAEQLNDYRDMLESSKTQAVLAMKELVTLYNVDPANKSLQVKITHGDKSATSNLGEKGLTRAEYLAGLKTAHEKGDAAEVKRLNAARALGRKQGI